MGSWRAKNGAQVAPLVAGDKLQKGAFVSGQDGLDTTDEGCELVPGSLIIVEFNAGKAQEEGNGWAQFGEKGAVPALLSFKDSG